MAVFAAYAEANQTSSDSNLKPESTWLTNSSFKIDVTPFQEEELQQLHPKHLHGSPSSTDTDDEDERESRTRRKKSKKAKTKKSSSHKRKKRKEHKRDKEPDSEQDEYTIDKKRITEYKYVNTISRPSAPKYRIYRYIQINNQKKKKKFKRYYQVILDKHVNESGSEQEKITKADLNKEVKKDDNPAFTGFQQEEDMSRTTASFNRDLQNDTSDIEMWIKYVKFQDAVFNFEKSFRKGSIAKGLRVTAERKLSILDKALQHNPNCEKLLRMRLNIAASVFPADELQTQLEKLVSRDSANIILWQGYIEATQCSMSHCTTPAVINLYIKCLHTLHTIRRTAKVDRAQLEESILRMLYQCGLFLKQAGLFEQLWTLLRMYLELNLSPSSESRFSTVVPSDDRQLEELEDIVLKSQLPIHELWLRVEKLREASHWLPISGSACEDPQRLVFSEDVSELIHPITMPGNTFRLTVTILTLLKIPLLPCRHTTMKMFGIDYVPWSLDSIESLLPIFLPLYPIDISNRQLLRFTEKLAIGPQYLKTLPGQEEFLQFILTIMQACIDCLDGKEQTAITVWWFRFQRLLIVLEKEELFKITTTFKKKLRSDMKGVLKGNPSCVPLFNEYALVEYENGNAENAINVLKTAVSMSCHKAFFLLAPEEQAYVTSSLRTLIELHLFASKDQDDAKSKETKSICIKYICAVVLGNDINTLPRFVVQATVNEAKEKFAEVIASCVTEDMQELYGVDHFLPDFITDWLILNAWFLYLNDSIRECRIFMENLLAKLDELNIPSWRKEVLYEFLVAILYKNCVEVPGSGLYPMLDKYLQIGIGCFPNNLFLLATLAKVQSFHSNYGQPWWKIENLLMKSGHALSTVFLILITNQRITDIESNWMDTVTGEIVTSNSVSFKNRMLGLFKRITRNDMCTRRCGLVWRLYLQFLHSYFEPKTCRAAYYIAVEECPWLKSLYIDAAIYIPEDLAQIQDLIIEKQLRIHVTPEELEVLRS